MAGFTKLFSTIVTSSIWCEDNETRLVWITMLALSDAHGMVEAAVPGLANAARVSVEKCQTALDRFQQPDPYSRSTAHEGRRIEKVEGGWKLLNYEDYRQKLSKSDRLDYQRVKQAEYRSRKKGKPTKGETAAVKALKNGDVAKFEEIAATR